MVKSFDPTFGIALLEKIAIFYTIMLMITKDFFLASKYAEPLQGLLVRLCLRVRV